MTGVHFNHGIGRLLHTGEWVVYTVEPDSDLLALFSESGTNVKDVGKHIFTRNLEISPFIAIHLPAGLVLVFGDLSASIGSDQVHGLDTSPWVERVVPAGTSVTVGSSTDLPDTLRSGEVSAAAFELLITSALSGTPADTLAEHPVLEPVPLAPNVAINDSSPGAPAEVPSNTSHAEAPEPQVANSASNMVSEPEASAELWDPLADPDVDLERIGVIEAPSELTAGVEALGPPAAPEARVVEPPEPETSQIVSPEDFVPDDTIDGSGPRSRMEPPAPNPAPLPPPPTVASSIPPPPTGLPAMNGPGAPIPPPPSSSTNDDLKSAPTMPAPIPRSPASGAFAASEFSVRFDDGQIAAVNVGLYVGRHPTKKGLPAQYQSVTIRGEHVSRLHWEIAVENGVAIIRDLGSNGGTKVETNGQEISVPDGGMQLAPGSTVHFADRWARLETE